MRDKSRSCLTGSSRGLLNCRLAPVERPGQPCGLAVVKDLDRAKDREVVRDPEADRDPTDPEVAEVTDRPCFRPNQETGPGQGVLPEREMATARIVPASGTGIVREIVPQESVTATVREIVPQETAHPASVTATVQETVRPVIVRPAIVLPAIVRPPNRRDGVRRSLARLLGIRGIDRVTIRRVTGGDR